MGKWYQTDNFKELQKQWYDKLKKDGFEDAEKLVAGEPVLTQLASNAYRQASQLIRESKLAYYQLLSEYVSKCQFDDEVDKIVMERKAEGAKIREISEELRKLGKRCHRQTIRFILRKYENRWGIRKWKPSQMKTKTLRK